MLKEELRKLLVRFSSDCTLPTIFDMIPVDNVEECFRQCLDLERIFYEDNIFMTRVMLAAKRASHRPWRFYIRKVHADSTVTSKPTMRHLRGHLACFKDACGLIENMTWERSVRKALVDRRTVYKLNVRRVIDACPELLVEAKTALPADEYELLEKIMVYPIGEKIVNGFRCLHEHGFLYTVRRILFGRQL